MKEEKIMAFDDAECSNENLLANLTPEEREEIRQQVLEAIAEADRGEYTEYVGRAGLKQLFEEVKARGRERLLARDIAREQVP
jgi:hypothetical protein